MWKRLLLGAALGAAEPPPFLVEPYLQLGEARPGSAVLLWHTEDREAAWTVQVRLKGTRRWTRVAVRATRIAVPRVEPHRVQRAELRGLGVGRRFDYRVLQNGCERFRAEGRSLSGATQRVVITGDIAMEGFGWKPLAHRIWQERPDYVVVPGDIVYDAGRIPEYRTIFFPVINAARPDPAQGAPLMRSRILVGALGNHDLEQDKPAKQPDGLAYYLYFDQPLNGPISPKAAPSLPADGSWDAFRQAAGSRFPRMGSFSFDVGPVHWTILDSNPQMDWTSPEFQRWLDEDLAKATQARWKFVVMHHPLFQTSTRHGDDQWMRLIAPLLQQRGVNVVFAGHVHNYQRTVPLTFTPEPQAEQSLTKRRRGEIRGTFARDLTYDGRTRTRPQGIIHVVTGAGGAVLYEPERDGRPETWAPFIAAYHAGSHSITVMEVSPERLEIRQVTPEGREVDRFVVTQAP